MTRAPVICVDGPSGSGKGTLSRRLAQRLGWQLLDSGALYRLTAILALRAGLDPARPEQCRAAAALARGMRAQFLSTATGDERIILEDQDVTQQVRDEGTGDAASRWAALPEIREALLDRQRAFRQPPGLVADGRDMGTVVFPDAPLKIFVSASADERARRRVAQLKGLGLDANIDKIYSEIAARDARDQQRQHSPLIPAADAVLLDTTALSPEAVLDEALRLARARGLGA
ncbi:MAG TPA: (d)CMP kinase [Nevskiales bacterium]|nr:(d)CMP kinase [Nevskiales bacterium]